MPTPQEVAFQAIYLPTFRKVAAANGFSLDTPEALNEALDLTAYSKQLLESQGANQIKQASHALKTALGVPAARTQAGHDWMKSAAELVQNPEFVELALAL